MPKKLTSKQKEIIAVLEQYDGALSVAEIHAQTPGIDLATVYRAVDRLSKEGLIKKLILDDKKALYEHTEHSHHHALCDNCDEIIHFQLDESKIKNLIDIPNFEASDVEIIVRGRHN